MLNKVMNPKARLPKSEASCPDFASSVYDDDLAFILSQEDTKRIDLTKFVEHMKEHNIGPVGICAICGKYYTYGGHNPYPVVKDGSARCCTRCCHSEIVKDAREEATFAILNESKGRKPLSKSELHINPSIIVNHVNRVDVMKAARKYCGDEESTFYFVEAKYKAPFFVFRQAGCDDVVTIDKRKIDASFFGANNELIIHVRGELPWSFYPYYDEIIEHNLSLEGASSLQPHEMKRFLVKTAEIESDINARLEIDDASVARAYVRLRPFNNTEKVCNPDNPYGYCHDLVVGNDNWQHFIMSFQDIFTGSIRYHGYISEDAMRVIASGLMKYLFTAEKRNESNQ